MSKHNLSKSQLIERYKDLAVCKEAIVASLDILTFSFSSGGKLLIAGNGGSSADAEHFCGELVKGFLLDRNLSDEELKVYSGVDSTLGDNLQNGLPCISLGVGHSLISAFSNDKSWDYAFAQQVHVLGNSNDVFVGISTSGNSTNIVKAAIVAKCKGMKVIGLTGNKPSGLSEISDVCIMAPSSSTHEIQEYHLPIYHAICIELEKFFYEN